MIILNLSHILCIFILDILHISFNPPLFKAAFESLKAYIILRDTTIIAEQSKNQLPTPSSLFSFKYRFLFSFYYLVMTLFVILLITLLIKECFKILRSSIILVTPIWRETDEGRLSSGLYLILFKPICRSLWVSRNHLFLKATLMGRRTYQLFFKKVNS